MSKEKNVKQTSEELKKLKDESDWDRAAGMTDEEIEAAFGVAAVISIGAVVLACFIRNTKPPLDDQSMGHQPGTGEERASEAPAATRS